MVQTKHKAKIHPRVEYLKVRAEYTTKPVAKQTKRAKGKAMSKEEEIVQQWKRRQEEVYRRASHANMLRSNEIAQKAEKYQKNKNSKKHFQTFV